MWHYAAAGLVALGLGFAGGWQVRAWKAGADDRDRAALEQRDQLRRADNADRAAAGHESFKTKADARERAVSKEVRRVANDPAMQRECIGPAGMQLLLEDIRARAAPGEPAPAVPPASTPR
jgi:hypothetical protein